RSFRRRRRSRSAGHVGARDLLTFPPGTSHALFRCALRTTLFHMRILTQASMQRLFTVLDEIEVDREQVQVPLEMAGEGAVTRLANGRFEIVLPDADDLAPFLAGLPERLRAAGAGPEP